MAKGDPTNPSNGAGFFPGVYQSALGQTAEDYDSIMKQYKDLGSKVSSEGGSRSDLNYTPITPHLTDYSAGDTSGINSLRDFSSTGGFDEAGINDIRARAIAPIRSIYDSANRNLSRQKVLSGGYAPNFGAVSAKLARDSAGQIGNVTTNANAAIAEMVQRGKLAGATALAPLEQREHEFANNFASQNTDRQNQADIFNAQMPLSYAKLNMEADNTDFDKILETIKGQQSTYGTTPALMSTLGNQTLNAANTVNSFPPVQAGALKQPAGGVNMFNRYGSGGLLSMGGASY